MIEEILPVLAPHKRLKMLSPKRGIINNLPSVDSHISFLPFVNFLKDKLTTISGTRADFYRRLIQKFEATPVLLQQVSNIKILNDHEELLELLTTAIFPIVSDDEENNFTLSSPYQFNIFSYSETFKNIFVDKEEEHLQLPEEISEEHLKEIQCSMIYDHVLEKYYGIKLNDSPELVYPVRDSKTGHPGNVRETQSGYF